MIIVASILGTIIPQNADFVLYLRLYGHVFCRLFKFFRFFDVYHSWWFQLLLFMLASNIIACTFKSFPSFNKLISNKRLFLKSNLKKVYYTSEIISNKEVDSVYKICDSVILSEFKSRKLNKNKGGVIINAESGYCTKLGAHIIHLSIILMLLGGLITSLFGFEGFVNIIEGDTINKVQLKGDNGFRTLDFGVRCDSFEISFYDNGVPKLYKSNLTIIDENVPVLRNSVTVNNPMEYDGISIFQASYGKIPASIQDKVVLPEYFEIEFTSKNSSKKYIEKLERNVPIELPEKLGNFSVIDYLSSGNFRGMTLGKTLKCLYSPYGVDEVEVVLLPVDFPNFDLMRNSGVIVRLSEQLCEKINLIVDIKTSYYTGLQISRDPGKWLVYLGFFLILIGFFITLMMTYKKVTIRIDKNSKIFFSACTNRNKLVLEKIANRISDLL